ncbi:MAG: bis(5'-nucleosyl)-tetraphosphatase (symmetrical) YqeK [bacterium]|nr:bis(5'-nucleosyl)-tetraphosphatase (symmetrical) YqeK [bacterium]
MNCTEANEKAISWLQGNVDEQRLIHSLGCAQEAAKFAQMFGLDEKKAYVAGLLHDCAKCLEFEKLFEIAQTLNLDEKELTNKKVLHAPVSAYLASSEFGITDTEILSAIRWHTLGKLEMTLLEKIVFLADKIEPNTRDLEFREKALLFIKNEENKEYGLDRAILLCYKETIKSLVARNLKIHQSTIDIYNSMLK